MTKFLRNVCALSLGLSTALLANASDSWTDSLEYRSRDGEVKLRLGGRLHADAAIFEDDVTQLDDDTEFRRARLNISGSFYKDWKAKVEYDFAANDNFEWKNIFLGYNGFKNTRIKVGNLQQPIGLEELTSSNNITFMERSLGNVFTPSYHLGATADFWGERWTAQVGMFDDTIADIENDNDGATSVSGRFVWRPWKSSGRLLHFGLSGQLKDVGSGQSIRFNARPESNLVDIKDRFVSSSTIRNAEDQTILNLEAAYVHGPFSAQGEYSTVELDVSNSSNISFSSWYAQASWILTGEHRRYSRKSGTFVSVKPNSTKGAIEIAARLSAIDLEDAGIEGGKESNFTLGLNWYVNRYSRFMLNYVAVDADPNKNGVAEKPNIIQARYQFAF